MDLSKLSDNAGARKRRMRVGRGIGSGKGKTAGRGYKGAKSRSGYVVKGFEGGQMPLHRRLPKRGFTNLFAKDFAIVNIGRLQAAIEAGTLDPKGKIDAEALIAAGIVRPSADGVRLLAKGDLKTKLTLVVAHASAGALAAVEKAGGKVEIVQPRETSTGA
ncbi:MAG: 50S ribosomal protein L15 [Pseudomonadota bacterium]